MHGRPAKGSHVNNWGINSILVWEIYFRNYFNAIFPLNKTPSCVLCRVMMSFNQNISYQFLSLPQTPRHQFCRSHTSPQTIPTFQRRSWHGMRDVSPSLLTNFKIYLHPHISCLQCFFDPYKKNIFALFTKGLAPIPYQLSISIRAPTRHPSSSLLSSLAPAKLKLIKSCQQIITAVCGAPESYFHYLF